MVSLESLLTRAPQRTAGGGVPLVFQVTLYELTEKRPAGVAALVEDLGRLLLGYGYSWRWLFQLTPFALTAAVAARRALGATLPAGARREGISADSRFLTNLDRQLQSGEGDGRLMARTAYLLVWGTGGQTPAVLGSILADRLHTAVDPRATLPILLPVRGGDHPDYREEIDHLVPLVVGAPYAEVLTSFSPHLQGTLFPWSLFRLLDLGVPLTLAVDFETLPAARARELLRQADRNWTLDLNAPQEGETNIEGGQAQDDVQAARAAIGRHQRLHRVSAAILVQGPTLRSLRAAVAQVQGALPDTLPLRVARHRQWPALGAYFGPTPPKPDGDHRRAKPLTSRQAAVVPPLGRYAPEQIQGILLAVAASGYPMFDLGWWDPRTGEVRPHHRGTFGITGGGKSVAEMAWNYRDWLLHRTQIIAMEPKEDLRALVAAVGEAGRYFRIDTSLPFNVLDTVEDEELAQALLVEQQLTGLINAYIADPRQHFGLAAAEVGVFRQALRECYPDPYRLVPAAEAPLLEELCARLASLEGGQRISDIIRTLLVVEPAGRTYNRPTGLDLTMQQDVCVYSLINVPEALRGFYSTQLFRAMSRHARHRPDPRRRLRCWVDELYWMVQVPGVLDLMAREVAVVRGLGTGWTFSTQTLDPFLHGPQGGPSVPGQTILENLQTQIYFKSQTTAPARILSLNPELTAAHVASLPDYGPGQCLILRDRHPTLAQVVLSVREQRFLLPAAAAA